MILGGPVGMGAVTWIFYMSKILDFFDTVFIILRCRWRQLSFLHVYHHSSIFMVRAPTAPVPNLPKPSMHLILRRSTGST